MRIPPQTARPKKPPVARWSIGLLAWALIGTVIGACDRSPGVEGGPLDTLAEFGGLGDTPGRFAYPRAIDSEISADGQEVWLWVIDRSARVQQIDPKSGRCRILWRMPDSELGKPVGFTIGPGHDALGKHVDKLLYVADTHYNRVMVYQPPEWNPASSVPGDDGKPERMDGGAKLVASFGKYGMGSGEFIYPTDIALQLAADGKTVDRIFVSEYGGNDRISVFDGDYKFLFSFGSRGSGEGIVGATAGAGGEGSAVQFDRPQSLGITELGGQKRLVVTDARNHRLGIFTLEGSLIRWIGSPRTAGAGPGQFNFPYGLGLLGDGTALICEFGNNRVQRIDLQTGASMGVWGHAGRGDGELAGPWAVAIVGAKTYIVDAGNNRVLGFATPRRRT